MIDNESDVFNVVSGALREIYEDVFIIGEEITSAPSVFPAVSIVQTDNRNNEKYSTFDNRENVAEVTYKVEVYSNLQSGRSKQTKAITATISDIMDALGYRRTFCNSVINADATISRRVSRFIRTNVIADEFHAVYDENGNYKILINNNEQAVIVNKDGCLAVDLDLKINLDVDNGHLNAEY